MMSFGTEPERTLACRVLSDVMQNPQLLHRTDIDSLRCEAAAGFLEHVTQYIGGIFEAADTVQEGTSDITIDDISSGSDNQARGVTDQLEAARSSTSDTASRSTDCQPGGIHCDAQPVSISCDPQPARDRSLQSAYGSIADGQIELWPDRLLGHVTQFGEEHLAGAGHCLPSLLQCKTAILKFYASNTKLGSNPHRSGWSAQHQRLAVEAGASAQNVDVPDMIIMRDEQLRNRGTAPLVGPSLAVADVVLFCVHINPRSTCARDYWLVSVVDLDTGGSSQ